MMNVESGMPKEQPPARRRRFVRIAVAACLIVGLVVAVKFTRYYFLPRRLAVVVPGQIYRSGYLEAGPLQRTIERYHLKTILVLLNNQPDTADQQQEEAIASQKGVRIVRIGMPGSGVASFDQLEAAAAVLADSSNHPVLVHCQAGVNRTGAVCAVWRMKYCGWDYERALGEARDCGYSPRNNPELAGHLREFYRARVARPATTSRPAT